MMKIGLFFGSFNPIHNGHLMLANYCLNHCELDKITFIVSPQNPFKEENTLLPFYERVNIVENAIRRSFQLSVCDIEYELPKPSYTSQTLRHIREYKDFTHEDEEVEFYLIMGLDNWLNIHKWKDFNEVLNHNIIVYPRIGDGDSEILFNTQLKTLNRSDLSVKLLADAPLCNLSSTFVRNEIKSNKSIDYYLPDYIKNLVVDSYLTFFKEKNSK